MNFIRIVEKNPNKFKIENKELSSRRSFIDATRDEVKSMKDKMSINRSRDIDLYKQNIPLLENTNSPHKFNNNINCTNTNNNFNLSETGKNLISKFIII